MVFGEAALVGASIATPITLLPQDELLWDFEIRSSGSFCSVLLEVTHRPPVIRAYLPRGSFTGPAACVRYRLFSDTRGTASGTPDRDPTRLARS